MGKKYKHFKGDIYTVICKVDCEAEPDNADKVIVAYRRSGGTGRIWCRPSFEFYGYKDGVRRFVPVEDGGEGL